MSNIKVCVKLRPLSQQDKKIEKAEEWKVIDNKSLECLNILHPCDFKFDHIFGTKSINYEVYMSFVKPIVDRCLNGYDGTVIAYGPTSAGKNHTLLGTDMDPGIILIAIERLFKTTGSFQRTIRFGYIEIYKEKIYDLLNDRKPVSIDRKQTDDITLSNDDIVVESFEKAVDMLLNGSYKRKSSAENVGKLSSLSHSVFRITIESEDKTNGKMQISCLRFVYVADCEPISDSSGDGSNTSLLWLKTVINALSKGEKDIKFNKSILTTLLRESLIGKTYTALVCNVKAVEIVETISALIFAGQAKNVRTFPARSEMHSDRGRSSTPAVDVKMTDAEQQLKEIANTKVENCLLRKELEEVKAAFAAKTTWFEEQMKSAEFAQRKLAYDQVKDKKSFERIQKVLESKIEKLSSSNKYLLEKLEGLQQETTAEHSLSKPNELKSEKLTPTRHDAQHLEIDPDVKAGIKRKIERLANEWERHSKARKNEPLHKKTDVKRTTDRTRTLSSDETESHTTTVSNCLIGRVIGSGGVILRSLTSTTGARIKISERNKDSDRVITINGNKSSVSMAVEMIQKMLHDNDT